MSHKSQKFFVQAEENGQNVIVPHTGKKNYEFIQKEKAEKFRDELKENNPETKFRLVIHKEELVFDKWK